MLREFHFLNPEYFLVIFVMPALAILVMYSQQSAKNKLIAFLGNAQLSKLLSIQNLKIFDRNTIFFLLAIFCLIVALARPRANPELETREGKSLDIILLLDVSNSMAAEDIYPSRLQKAKHSINTMLDQLAGDRVGLVAFAGSAVLVTPLTSDYDIVRTFLNAIDTKTILNQGTNIEQALQISADAFAHGSESSSTNEQPSHIVIIFSDGEVNQGSELEIAKTAAQQGIIIHAIAVGTERGAPIPIRDDSGQLLTYKKDIRGESVVTKVNATSLKHLAEIGGGQFFWSTTDEQEIKTIVDASKNLIRADTKEVQAKVYTEYFYIPLLIGILCFMAPYLLPQQKTIMAIAFLALFLDSHSLFAEEKKLFPTSTFYSSEKNHAQEALQDFSNEKFKEANEKFKALQSNNPESPELSYDVGTTAIKEKKYDQARNTLGLVQNDPQLSDKAKFNIAGSYAEEGNLPNAKKAYADFISSLVSKPNLTQEEKNLLAQAQKNLEFLSSSKQKEQQQQQQDKQNKKNESQQKQRQQEQENKDKKDEKKEEEQKPKQEEQKKSENYATPQRKKQFQENKDLSESEAKQILDTLKNRELELQRKTLREKAKAAKPESNTTQDW